MAKVPEVSPTPSQAQSAHLPPALIRLLERGQRKLPVLGQRRAWMHPGWRSGHPHAGPADPRVSTNMLYGTFATALGQHKGLMPALETGGLYSQGAQWFRSGLKPQQETGVCGWDMLEPYISRTFLISMF